MRVIADLHIHSKYSRACSKDLDLEHNAQWSAWKGITLLGTGDFTHPAWLRELKEKLEPGRPGLFRLVGSALPVDFMLTTELSCIYTQGGKVRRIHLCILCPSFAAVDAIVASLEQRGCNLRADGRPILGVSALELTKIVFAADPTAMVIPAHAWTPWFSVFGSKSGFDTLEECFGEYAPEIFAIETGLSSDPAMNWRLSQLDRITLISNSDAHSPANLAREGNVFEIPESELSYNTVRRILQTKDRQRFAYTIEFFPEEGKYHLDGHRACGVCLEPAETKKLKSLCPKCGKSLTVGVLHRVDDLADRPVGYQADTIPFKSIVPLQEVIAETLGVGKSSKKVQAQYHEMIQKGGTEFGILLDVPIEDIAKFSTPLIAQAIENIRRGNVAAIGGYDGEYGVIKALGKDGVLRQRQPALF